MRSNFRGNERMVPHIRVHLLDVRFCWVVYLEKKVKVMSKFESNVQYIKYLVNRECASRFFNGELDKEINMERRLRKRSFRGQRHPSAAVFIRSAILLRTVCVWFWSRQRATV